MSDHLNLHTSCNPVVLEVQLLSEEDINSGVNVTFPTKDTIVSVESEVPNPTLSMQIMYMHSSNNSILYSL